MQDKLITFETARLAKKKGFNEPCREAYSPEGKEENVHFIEWKDTITNSQIDNSNEQVKKSRTKLYPEEAFEPELLYTAPTQSLLQKWLREVHNQYVEVRRTNNLYITYCINDYGILHHTDNYKTYELALEAGLLTALRRIK